MNPPALHSERLHWPEGTTQDIEIDVLRLDLLHPVLSGNKWFKLHRHLELAGRSPILTFGGAWSNHLVATAFAAQQAGISAIGIIRGERPSILSATLQEAAGYGMQLEFITREQYAQKTTFLKNGRFPGTYIIPEGGGGLPGIIGSESILSKLDAAPYTHILCAVGTGTTFLGLVRASRPGEQVIGIPVLKGLETISAIDPTGILTPEQAGRAQLLPGYHFGGFGRHPQTLLDFMNDFYTGTGIPTDIVYTGKLFYALQDSLRHHFFPARSRLLLIHSGGLQGNRSLAPGQLIF